MRSYNKPGRYLSKNVQFRVETPTMPDGTDWTWVTPLLNAANELGAIWHVTNPLQKVNNIGAEKVISHIENELCKWLDAESIHSVDVPLSMSLDDHTVQVQERPTLADVESVSARLIFEYVTQVAEVHLRRYWKRNGKDPKQSHLNWAGDDTVNTSPGSFFWSFFQLRTCVAGFMRLMRFPGLYEGMAEYTFEKYLTIAIGLIFDSQPVLSLPNDAPSMYANPLLVTCCTLGDLTNEIKQSIALALQPTLRTFIRLNADGSSSLPEHCFVFGIHWSKSRLSILIHFPIPVDQAGKKWKFCQVLAAEHWVALAERTVQEHAAVGAATQDDQLLNRWRLTIALFFIRAHVQRLQHYFHHLKVDFSSSHVQNWSTSHTERLATTGLSTIAVQSVGSSYLQAMRQAWRGVKLGIPREWVPTLGEYLVTKDNNPAYRRYDKVNKAMRFLAKVYFNAIRDKVSLLDKPMIESTHAIDADERQSHGRGDMPFQKYEDYGPDFIHRPNVPRSAFEWAAMQIEYLGSDTGPYLHRTYDLLSMAALTWHDIQIFLANTLAGFSSYAVRWQPAVHYPFDATLNSSKNIVCDFVLAEQFIPPGMPETIARAPSVPITIYSPAVLLGVRAMTERDTSSASAVASSELDELKLLMKPHLQILRDRMAISVHDANASCRTLLCTYLKPGYIHIFAFTLQAVSLETQVTFIDTLPVMKIAEGIEDLHDRLRLAIALFSLQRHVIRYCTHWASLPWSPSTLADEHEAILQETGICTPSASRFATVPPSKPVDPAISHHSLDSGRDSRNTAMAGEERVEEIRDEIGVWLSMHEPYEPIVEAGSYDVQIGIIESLSL
ncbi:unnamed protein product [Somion occarium]|uniref:Uncharacterized protein n=1 Tax=Somion occarium TaxID=3059160 RepID=A0ABP1DF02_9APHY